MLKVSNLTQEYSQLLFNDINFVLGNKEKVGLVGLNGCGKSTLLKIIMGEEAPDKGKVEIVKERIGYLPQEFVFDKDILVGEFLEGLVDNATSEMYRVNKILAKLKLNDIDLFQYFDTLSGGEKMKLYLTKLLIDNPTILLLDEPTNHLDIFGIMWFEDFINNFDGICIIISHDRQFLNNVTNKIFEIDEQKLYIFEGNYDDYLVGKDEFIADRQQQFVLQERKRKKFEDRIELVKKFSSGKKQSKMLSNVRKRMEREVTAKEINAYEEKSINNLKIKGSVHKSKKMIELKNLNFGYTKDHLLLEDVNFETYGDEKIWFYGSNGIGKTTLIKLIVEEIKQLSGDVVWGEKVKWEYFSQDQSHLDMDMKVEDYFLKNTGASYGQSFGILEKFLFTRDHRGYTLGQLSPGQRARLSFAVFTQHNYDYLILDEPTNHLDIKTKEVIEKGIHDFQGGVLLISHDRYFVQNVGIDRVITIEDKKVVDKNL